MILALAQVQDEQQYGGKATQLGACLRAGLPVPPGVGLSVAMVQAVVRGDQAAVGRVFDSVAGLGAVAVRSSGVGEDSGSSSFAGQHATVLDVRSRNSLAEAIRSVWASGCSASALGYRQRLGLSSEPRMGVVVQQLVPSDQAGVLFTCNPMNGADECVIEAAWGLGEVVVAGLVSPDHYRVARNGRILERTAGEKDIAIRSLPDGGTAEVAVAPQQVCALCLTDAQLQALLQLARRCELHHGNGPHDLEFAFVGEQLYLLQCRAITRGARP